MVRTVVSIAPNGEGVKRHILSILLDIYFVCASTAVTKELAGWRVVGVGVGWVDLAYQVFSEPDQPLASTMIPTPIRGGWCSSGGCGANLLGGSLIISPCTLYSVNVWLGTPDVRSRDPGKTCETFVGDARTC